MGTSVPSKYVPRSAPIRDGDMQKEIERPDLKVLVAVLSNGTWKAKTAMSMLGLVTDFYVGQWVTRNRLLVPLGKQGSTLSQMRQEAARTALDMDCTHMLFVDSDQSFPPDALRRLWSWNLPVVACNIATKNFPTGVTARTKSKRHPEGKIVWPTEKAGGLRRVWRVGTGIMLIKTEVFRTVDPPWFPVKYKGSDRYQHEDWGFCERLEMANIPIFIDQDLSWEVGHWGEFNYELNLVEAQRQVAAQVAEQVRKEKENGSRERIEDQRLERVVAG